MVEESNVPRLYVLGLDGKGFKPLYKGADSCIALNHCCLTTLETPKSPEHAERRTLCYMLISVTKKINLMRIGKNINETDPKYG